MTNHSIAREDDGGHAGTDTAPNPLPPYLIVNHFLGEALIASLLDYTLQNESKFTATKIQNGIVDPSRRASVGLDDIGPMKPEIKTRLRDLVPSLIRQLRVTPFELAGIELELVAHGNGAFYKRHIDTHTGDANAGATQRMVSGVYYFHAEPKAFSGGALRLHAFGASDANTNFVDIQPEQDTLVVFPSWAIHEVRPIECPSKRFIDSRFAINCWLRRTKPTQKT